MRNSSTFRSGSALRLLLLALALMHAAPPVAALDANRGIAQYLHDHWGAEQGFPGGAVHAFAQTTDGYLWIGAEEGLIRFDGMRFVRFDHANTPGLPDSPVLGLQADAEGGLWIRLQNFHLLRYAGGAFTNPLTGHADLVPAMCGAEGGAVLLRGATGIFRYANGELEPILSQIEPLNRLVISMAQTADGKVWLGTRDSGLYFMNEDGGWEVVEGARGQKINSLLPHGDRGLWVGSDGGVFHWDGSALSQAGISTALRQTQALALAADRESNIWIGTASGLVRLDSSRVSTARGSGKTTAVTALFEDREGNLWAGGPAGIDRYRDRAFWTYVQPETSLGNYGPLYSDAEGRTWFAPSSGGLFWLRGSRRERVSLEGLDEDVVYSISGGPGEVWVGRQRGGVTQLRYAGGSFTAKTYTDADGLAQNTIYALHCSRDGAVWAGTLNGGLSRLERGEFTTYTDRDGLGSNAITAIEESPDGTMWFATPSGLHALSKGQWRTYGGAAGLPPGGVSSLLVDSSGGLWVGTAAGLAFLEGDRIHTPPGRPPALGDEILGIAEDANGALWIATPDRVVRADGSRLRRGALGEGGLREYGIADGLVSAAGVRRHRSVMADPLGRIWFSTAGGISVVDPTRLASASAPAIAHVETVAADGRTLDPIKPVVIPPGSRSVTFAYTGLSLAVPQQVRFRYRLDDIDAGWSDPVAARQAVYANLGPGRYRFRVAATNPDGGWSSSEGEIAFEVAPQFWQTSWFRLSGALALCLAVAGAYRVRMNQLTSRLNLRFEERLAERTRVAHELHDTLLQGFLSASMQLHVTAEQLPEDSPVKPPLNRVMSLMGKVIDEGRKAVQGLRSRESEPLNLEHALSRTPRELSIGEDVDLRVIASGTPKELHPVLRDEVYRIAREAVVNALRHAEAKTIEVEVEYTRKTLRVSVRDDGCGISPSVLQAGRAGHWGLIGMRERAERVGGRLRVFSRPSDGTQVELVVPGRLAFRSPSENGVRRWLGRWMPWRSEREALRSRNWDSKE